MTSTTLPTAPKRSYKLSFFGTLRSESLKFRTLATNWVMLLLTIAIMIGMSAAYATALNRFYQRALETQATLEAGGPSPQVRPEYSFTVDQVLDMTRSIGGVGMMFGSMLIASIAVVFIGAEYATRQIHSTMTAVPRRSSIYISKLLVLSVWSFLVGVISAVAGYFVAQPVLDPGISEQLSVGTPTVLNWLGVGLYCLLMSWMGLGFGAILRNNAGGIVMVVVFMFISTIVFGLLAETADWVADFQPYLPINLGETMTTVGLPEDANINNLEAGIWLGVWALVPALLGWFRFTFTDAKG